MKAKVQGYLGGANLSWGKINQAVGRELLSLGHQVDFISTDGVKHFPKELQNHIISKPNANYNLQFSYTAPPNIGNFLGGSGIKIHQWAWEFGPIIPIGFAKHFNCCDYTLAPSSFVREVYLNSKILERKIKIIPHGIEENFFTTNKYPLKTSKTHKILLDINGCHLRKNLFGALEFYTLAFKPQEDVCLIVKVNKGLIKFGFEQDPMQVYREFERKYPKHPEIELITEYINNMGDLYNSCDIVYTTSFGEGFYLPGLQGLLLNKIVVAPGGSNGQSDFLNSFNSLVIETKVKRAPPQEIYWSPPPFATHSEPQKDSAIECLRQAIITKPFLTSDQMLQLRHQYSWPKIVKDIISLC